MDRMIYVAMSGAKEAMNAQSINSANLANASTTAFKADFQTSLSRQLFGPGHPSRVYTTVTGAGADLAQGRIVSTGRELDTAINGQGWFAVQSTDGREAYSRAGDLHVDSFGRLTNGAGNLIMGNKGPITIPQYASLTIGADGTISVQPLGDTAETMVVIDRIKLVNMPDADMRKGADGLMYHISGKPVDASADVQIVAGSLESSNVNSVDAMVRMIELARQYETHIKLMQSAEENDRAAAEIIRMT